MEDPNSNKGNTTSSPKTPPSSPQNPPPAVGDVGAVKKTRKVSEVKDPPRGDPTCPECNKTFSTWKGAFGHMRSHPDRNYRGFFKPPTFSPSSLVPAAAAPGEGGSGGGQSGEGGSSVLVPVSEIWIDLNIAMEGAGDPIEGGDENAEKEEKKT